ncbi:hypothetical protein E2C01_012111 [Portunus trituberculatus]|uniref:Uncharacterized protein n=1 Tax=Portunus trituberculatus TaxID=210409 RepID=A0A5B7DCZ5_PORTR|nr:hypothetical protein [Portunus trituberculatus]
MATTLPHRSLSLVGRLRGQRGGHCIVLNCLRASLCVSACHGFRSSFVKWGQEEEEGGRRGGWAENRLVKKEEEEDKEDESRKGRRVFY